MRLRSTGVIFGLLVAQLTIAGASESLRSGLKPVAERIQQLMKQNNAQTVLISEPDGPTAFGAGIRKTLEDEIARLLGRSAIWTDGGKPDVRVGGSFYVEEDKLHLDLTFKGANFKPLPISEVFRAPINEKAIQSSPPDEQRAITPLKFIAADLAPKAKGESRNLLSNNPGGMGADSKSAEVMGVQLQVLVNGQAIKLRPDPAAEKSGVFVPFADLKKSDEFELQINNPFDFAIGVEFELDGISSFARAEQQSSSGKAFSKWILPPKTAPLKMPGWFIRKDLSRAFRVTDFSQSVAAKLGTPDAARLGTITATVYRLKHPDDDRKLQITSETKTMTFSHNVPVKKTQTYTVVGPDGKPETKTREITVMVANMQTRTVQVERLGIGEGQEIRTNFNESAEKLVRAEDIAVLCVRYDKQPGM